MTIRSMLRKEQLMQNNISTKQNEVRMLKIQFTSRTFYNKAEKLNNVAFIISFLLMFVIFIPDESSIYLTILLPLFMQFLCFLIIIRRDKYVENAARLRNYFDSYVLNIKFEEYSDTQIREINELAEENCEARMDEYSIQSQNNGECDIPGVLDWYVIKDEINQIDAIYECQKQNIWWNINMDKFRFQLFAWISIFIVVVLIIIHIFSGFLMMILSFFAIFYLLFSYINNWFSYMIISYKISGIIDILDLNRNENGILVLQNLLIELRKLNLLQINKFHKIKANYLSKLYKKIISK